MDADLDALWDEYKRLQDQSLRDQLILHYSPLVKYVAGRVAIGLPQNVEQADLVSTGSRTDRLPSKNSTRRGYKFETYRRPHQGAIRRLRSIDWVPLLCAQSHVNWKSHASCKVVAPLPDEELAHELGITEEQLQNLLSQLSFVGLVALDELLVGGKADRGETLTLGDTIADTGDGPVGAYEVEEMRQILARSINRMPEREKIVLTLYYYEGLTLAEIGQVLGVTESTVCQIHTKAVLQLRSRISAAVRENAV